VFKLFQELGIHLLAKIAYEGASYVAEKTAAEALVQPAQTMLLVVLSLALILAIILAVVIGLVIGKQPPARRGGARR
jgi:hypothetical protein